MDSVVLFERQQMLDKWDKQINDVVAGEQCD